MGRVPFNNRLKELVCVIFGHQWDEYGSESHDGFLIEEYSKCSLCDLEIHRKYRKLVGEK